MIEFITNITSTMIAVFPGSGSCCDCGCGCSPLGLANDKIDDVAFLAVVLQMQSCCVDVIIPAL